MGMLALPRTQAFAQASEEKIYTLKPSGAPYKNKYTNAVTYNKYTKQYYMLRSYLERLEQIGGGTLVLTKGTYKITNILFVPSKVTIRLMDGAKLMKSYKTGTTKMLPSKSMFQLIAPSKSKINGVYGGYEGESDIHFIGTGSAVIDLDYSKDSIGIVIGHNSDISIQGITFQNMYSGHFIELDATRDITIENNTFQNHKASLSGIKEAINIDTPDKKTKGFNVAWTKYDGTPNLNVIIQNNSFENLERAIGTHKYTGGKYHENIQILNNTIKNTTSDAIRIINWKKTSIVGNKIILVAEGIGNDRGILASGLIQPTIIDNTFIDTARAIQLMPWKNNGAGSSYEITYNQVTEDEISRMLQNYIIRVREQCIRVNRTYNIFDRDTERYYFNEEYLK
jgi:hypothetical protein